MNDPALNSLLKWGIENSDASRNDPNAPRPPPTSLDPALLQQLFGGIAGTADGQMLIHMDKVHDDALSVEDRVVALEAFDDLISQIDNANNMENALDGKKLESLGLENLKRHKASRDTVTLWSLLVNILDHAEPELRMNAAMCTGTAVENNVRAQEKLLMLEAIPTLVRLATQDPDKGVRKKAVGALSRAVRNFQPGLNVVVDHVPPQLKPDAKLDAGDMESVDRLIQTMRTEADQDRQGPSHTVRARAS